MRIVAITLLVFMSTGVAEAAEINAMITDAVKAAIDDLTPSFKQETGNSLRVTYGPSGGLARRLLGGEPADIIIIGSGKLGELIQKGKVLPDVTAIARTGIAVCVRKGAPKPDVSTPEALKSALLAAKSVGYTDPAGGGITAEHIMKMFERLGIAHEIAPKTKLAAGGQDGRVSVLVSSGEAEIALQEVSELMTNPGVEVIGMLPAELQEITVFSGGITADAKQPAAGRALIDFLTKPAAMAVYKTKGLAF
ncbi:MAG TPA: substrate-binding domain-containing protein [Xanthobacteraceae bacterium]|jgi:molybdate transport system substrate-binding protein|nr:substrate-binding domain-containing protein [Xanthobacteraceae bacterium]